MIEVRRPRFTEQNLHAETLASLPTSLAYALIRNYGRFYNDTLARHVVSALLGNDRAIITPPVDISLSNGETATLGVLSTVRFDGSFIYPFRVFSVLDRDKGVSGGNKVVANINRDGNTGGNQIPLKNSDAIKMLEMIGEGLHEKYVPHKRDMKELGFYPVRGWRGGPQLRPQAS